MRLREWLRRPPDRKRVAHTRHIAGDVLGWVVGALFVSVPVLVPLYWGSELVQAISRAFGPEWRQWTSAVAFGVFEVSLVVAIVVAVKWSRRRQAATSSLPRAT